MSLPHTMQTPNAMPGAADDGSLARCTAVGRTYGAGVDAVVAVHSASVAVKPADRIAIVGPSGSGKSTLLHLLAGLETPTVGQVGWPALGGSFAVARRHIGLVFQAPSLIPSLSVVENVELPLLMRDIAPAVARERARDALALLSLDQVLDDLPQHLSGGQAQRVVIARVLAGTPRLILADEPTSRLDRATADHVIDVLLQVSDGLEAALVVATHDEHIGRRMNRVWSMRDGRPQESSHPRERP